MVKTESVQAPSFAALVQAFFAEHLQQQRAMSPRTVAAYRDAFVLFLDFAQARLPGSRFVRARLHDARMASCNLTNAVLQQELQPKMSQVSGLNIFALVPPSLPSAGGDGGGGEFVIGGVGELSQLAELADQILMKAMESKRFIFLDKDLKIDKPRIEVNIDRDKAASLGIDMRTLAADMAAMLSGGYTNRFAMQNRSYLVIPQVQRSDRLNASDLENYYTRTRDGELIPLSTIVTL